MYAWGKIGCCSHIKKFNENFTISAWIAFSQNSFYVIMVKRGTIRSIDFLEVLKALRFVKTKWTNNSLMIMLFWRITLWFIKPKLFRNYLLKYKMWAITIPPYEPSLNPAEQAILWIKRRYRSQVASSK